MFCRVSPGDLSCRTPPSQVSEDRARSLVEDFFRKEVSSVSKLDSYDDNNFRIDVAGGDETFTFKVGQCWTQIGQAFGSQFMIQISQVIQSYIYRDIYI